MSDDAADPKERAEEAVQSALNKLQQAGETDSPEEAGNLEAEAVDIAVEPIAQALVDGLNRPVGFYAEMLAEKSTYYNKTNYKQEISDKVEELSTESVEGTRLDDYINEELNRVIVHRSTDAKQGAKFTFDFPGFQVQTESGKDGRGHYHWGNFRNHIHEAGGPNLAKPQGARRSGDDWRDFMANIIDERGETRHVTGKRTRAVEKLQKSIKSRAGYGTATSALDNGGTWVVVESVETPPWWNVFGRSLSEPRDLSPDVVQEVRVHESTIDEATTDPDITRSALYQEVDARGHTVPGTGGPSMLEYIDGAEERFWTFLPTIGTPRTYVPDPRDDTKRAGSLLGDLEQPNESGATETERDSDGFEGVGNIA